jgi:hypothetical protein
MKKTLSILAATALIGTSVVASAADAQSTSKAAERISSQRDVRASELEGESGSGILLALLGAAALIGVIVALGGGSSNDPAPPGSP